jgi:HK97 family phage portal protein
MANWFQRFWSTGASQPQSPYFGQTMTNWSGSQVRDPAGLAAVRRCVSIISDSVAATPAQIVTKGKSGGLVALADHPAAKALRLLSYADTELLVTDALLTGNGFAIYANGRLECVAAHRVSAGVAAGGGIWYEISADERFDQAKRTLPTSQVVHLRYRVDPGNPLIGMSPLRAAKASHAALTEVYFLHERLAVNQSNPGMILSTDKDMSKEQVQRLRELWDAQAAGFKQGGTVILSNGLATADAKQHISQKDSDLVEALRFSVEEASRIYGVPPSMLGYSQHTSYSTSSEERRAFLSSTLRPFLIRVADAFSQVLLTESERLQGLSVEFDSSEFGAGRELAETISSLVNSGVLTLNEARNKLNLVDVPGGDIPRVPSNTMPQAAWEQYFNQTQQQPKQ